MTKIFVIIHYHRLLISIDGNLSINIIDCYQYAISMDYLFSRTFQLSISASTNKVTHFDIIALGNSTRSGSGRGRLHRHIKKDEEKEITISLIVFER